MKRQPSMSSAGADAGMAQPIPKGEKVTTLRVAGMDCAEEVEALEQALKPLQGVRSVRVNLMGGKVTVGHDRGVSVQRLVEAIAGAGLKASEEAVPADTDSGAEAQRGRLISVCLSGAFTG